MVQLYIGVSDTKGLCSRVLMRPIDKIVLLVESRDDVRSPTREPYKNNIARDIDQVIISGT